MNIREKKMETTKKDFLWNTIGTGINAFNSLFFLIIVTRLNGVRDAGVFTVAFASANLFNIIGVYSGRVYQVTDRSKLSDYDYFVHKIITCVIMMIITILFVFIRNYNILKSSIVLVLCLMKCLEAFSEVIYAFFQKNNHLYKVGISLTMKNIAGLFVFLIINLVTRNLLVSVIFLVAVYFLFIYCYDIKQVDWNVVLKKKIVISNIYMIFKKGFFTFCLSFLTMYLLNIPRYVIDSKMSDVYSTIFGILIMPSTIMVLLVQFMFHPVLLTMKKSLMSNIKQFKLLVCKLFVAILCLGIVVIFISFLVGIPFLEFVYNIKLNDYKECLMIIMCGAVLYGIVIMLSNVLITMRVTFLQVIIYLVNSILCLCLSNQFVISFGIYGVCLAYTISMLITCVCFVILLLFSLYNYRKKDMVMDNG